MLTLLIVTFIAAASTFTGRASSAPNSPQQAEHRWQWRWDVWMPAWAQRLAACEEHMNWQHHGSGYEGAFAFATKTWDDYRLPSYPRRAWLASPFQQWMVAKRVARAVTVGSAWGCWRGWQHRWVRAGLPERGFRG